MNKIWNRSNYFRMACSCRGGGDYWEFLVGVCLLVLQILTGFFRPKHVIFHTPFQPRPLKSIPVFRPGLWAEIMSSFLKLERKENNSSNVFRIRIFLFHSYSFGIESITTFIRFRTFENHTRFHTNGRRVYPCRLKNHNLSFGAAHSHKAFIREYLRWGACHLLARIMPVQFCSFTSVTFWVVTGLDKLNVVHRLYFDWEASLFVLVSH